MGTHEVTEVGLYVDKGNGRLRVRCFASKTGMPLAL